MRTKRVYVDLRICTGCRTCELACAVEHSQSKTLLGAVRESPRPRYRIAVESDEGKPFPLQCRHCEEPPCVDACKTGALRKDPETGATTFDREKCVGCWMCVMVCPFGVVFHDTVNGLSLKCDLCKDSDEGPACVRACPTGALFYGTVEEFKESIRNAKLAISNEKR